ncbi:hypothetical protein BDF14DRAFT_1813961 [Spinellus fusiger]|nr:hypothetical protein BDF14DRAFT_1813961 [Spinellus fusiger]
MGGYSYLSESDASDTGAYQNEIYIPDILETYSPASCSTDSFSLWPVSATTETIETTETTEIAQVTKVTAATASTTSTNATTTTAISPILFPCDFVSPYEPNLSTSLPNHPMTWPSPLSTECTETHDPLLFVEHMHVIPPHSPHTPPKPHRTLHKCPFCAHTSNRANNMKEHIRTHDPLRPKDFLCPLCDKKFAHKHDMKRHSKSHARQPRQPRRKA